MSTFGLRRSHYPSDIFQLFLSFYIIARLEWVILAIRYLYPVILIRKSAIETVLRCNDRTSKDMVILTETGIHRAFFSSLIVSFVKASSNADNKYYSAHLHLPSSFSYFQSNA